MVCDQADLKMPGYLSTPEAEAFDADRMCRCYDDFCPHGGANDKTFKFVWGDSIFSKKKNGV